MAGQKEPLDFSIMLTRLERIEHQVIALDLSLSSLSERHLISVKEAGPRREFVNHMKARLQRLRQVLLQDQGAREQGIDLGLPQLNDCSLSELSIIGEALDERLRVLTELFHQLQSYLQLVTTAAHGSLGRIRSTFALAKIRRVLENTGREGRRLSHDEESLLNLNQRLIEALSGKKTAHHLTGNVQGLIKLFEDIDATSGRIASAKARLIKEESRIQQMQTWLAENEARRFEAPANSPLPPPLISHELEQELLPEGLRDLDKNAERLATVRRYLANANAATPVEPHAER